jgi:hypothetical protein
MRTLPDKGERVYVSYWMAASQERDTTLDHSVTCKSQTLNPKPYTARTLADAE